MKQAIHQEIIDLHSLEGKWYIQMTTLPMWLKGDKVHPSLNYAVEDKGRKTGLRDVVMFTKNGQPKFITGFDKPINAHNTSFIWRGKGILSLLKSKWDILHFSTNLNWALIHFEKTLFTPEGYDVISRNKSLDISTQNSIQNKLTELNLADSLIAIDQ